MCRDRARSGRKTCEPGYRWHIAVRWLAACVAPDRDTGRSNSATLLIAIHESDNHRRIWSKFVLYSAPAIFLHTRTGH